MRTGTLISMPDAYTQWARIKDSKGVAYTVDPKILEDDAEVDDKYAYKVDLWENDSGLIYRAVAD